MFKKIFSLFYKVNSPIVEKKHNHATLEHVIINDNGTTETFIIGTTSYGKNSKIPLNERKPQTTIEYRT